MIATGWWRGLASLAALGVLCGAGCGPVEREGGREHPAPPATPYARSADGCRVVAPDASAGDRAMRACAQARAALTRLLAAPAPTGLVVVGDTAAGADALRTPADRWMLAIDASEAGAEREIGGGRQLSALGYLTHETAHRVAVAMIYPADTTFGPDAGYGSPLPDWLDEALALLTEPAADQEARLGLLFDDRMVYALPLRRFLYMTHPALTNAPPGSPVRRVFYGQALAFALFLRARGGDEGIRTLVRALRTGEKQGVALTGMRGMPADGGALEQDWLVWLRARGDSLRAAPGTRDASGTTRAGRRERDDAREMRPAAGAFRVDLCRARRRGGSTRDCGSKPFPIEEVVA